MTIGKPPAEGSDSRLPPNNLGPLITPLLGLILSTALTAIAGFLTDWHTASLVFLSATALFSSAQREP
ncbi:hypothetical protein NONI108955_26885 [Nocardia ninae]|uniref:Uncharacterized protein n=1 Tax=Nocardia ninae NBRC 108245 TaxID=1210091 RepID=A0A511MP31_9NOCA|nr:hypothetical protein [Nocardia ninae]GEM42375.1 hypothetical protein NN4_68940 [Nocardia ninae NBRC 108245]